MSLVYLSIPVCDELHWQTESNYISKEKEKMIRNYDAMTGRKNTYVDPFTEESKRDKMSENMIVDRIHFLAESLKILSYCDTLLLHPCLVATKSQDAVVYITALKYGIDDYDLEVAVKIVNMYVSKYVTPKRQAAVKKMLFNEGIWTPEILIMYTDDDILRLRDKTKGMGPTFSHEIMVLRDAVKETRKVDAV